MTKQKNLKISVRNSITRFFALRHIMGNHITNKEEVLQKSRKYRKDKIRKENRK